MGDRLESRFRDIIIRNGLICKNVVSINAEKFTKCNVFVFSGRVTKLEAQQHTECAEGGSGRL